jgi:hypothetical protein
MKWMCVCVLLGTKRKEASSTSGKAKEAYLGCVCVVIKPVFALHVICFITLDSDTLHNHWFGERASEREHLLVLGSWSNNSKYGIAREKVVRCAAWCQSTSIYTKAITAARATSARVTDVSASELAEPVAMLKP